MIEAIEREWARLSAAIDALGERATSAPVTEEGWTAKDVLAHLIHWAGQVAFGLGARLTPPGYVATTQGRPTGAEWNAIAVAFHADKTLAEIRAELQHIVDLILERARLRSDAEMAATGAIAWSEQELWRFIGGDTFLHWPQHAAAIEAATPEG